MLGGETNELIGGLKSNWKGILCGVVKASSGYRALKFLAVENPFSSLPK